MKTIVVHFSQNELKEKKGAHSEMASAVDLTLVVIFILAALNKESPELSALCLSPPC